MHVCVYLSSGSDSGLVGILLVKVVMICCDLWSAILFQLCTWFCVSGPVLEGHELGILILAVDFTQPNTSDLQVASIISGNEEVIFLVLTLPHNNIRMVGSVI